jgi:hypothetical protein
MIYAAAAVWLTVVVLLAWGVHAIWSSILKAKTVDGMLLPGTLVAQLGLIVGLLITGGTLGGASPGRDDEKRGAGPDAGPQSKIPVIGPLIVALLPMAALGGMLYLLATRLGTPILDRVPRDLIAAQLPSAFAAFWDQLRALITLAEGTLSAFRTTDAVPWRIALFIYLMVCFTVRLAPLPGNIRGHMGAIVVVGVVSWLAGTVTTGLPEAILRLWPILSLTVGWLLLLLLFSLLVRGIVSSVQIMTKT